MFNLGVSEMALIALLALLLIGPKQLPEVAKTLGRFLNDIKRSTNGIKEDIQRQVRIDHEEIRRQMQNKTHHQQNHQGHHETHHQPHHGPEQASSETVTSKKDQT